MITKKLLMAAWLTVTIAAWTVPAAAQQTEASGTREQQPGATAARGDETRLLKLKYADPETVFKDLSRMYPAVILPQPKLKALLVRARPEILDSIEKDLRNLDVASAADQAAASRRNIEYTAYILVSTDEAGSDGRMPDQLQPVIRQLKSTFGNRRYQLLDTLIARSVEGQGSDLSGICPFAADGASSSETAARTARYQFSLRPRRSADEPAGGIQIESLRFGLQVPIASSAPNNVSVMYQDVGISTSLSLREGQLAVVGKTGISNTPVSLILVITARTVE